MRGSPQAAVQVRVAQDLPIGHDGEEIKVRLRLAGIEYALTPTASCAPRDALPLTVNWK
jgi:hypothetical protein